MFAGLFVVVRAFEVHVLSRGTWKTGGARDSPIGLLAPFRRRSRTSSATCPPYCFSADHSGHASGVQETAWLALAMSSTLAGNLTVLGSVANLIVVEWARKDGVDISFWQYARVGIPVTITTLLIGVGWLQFAHDRIGRDRWSALPPRRGRAGWPRASSHARPPPGSRVPARLAR